MTGRVVSTALALRIGPAAVLQGALGVLTVGGVVLALGVGHSGVTTLALVLLGGATGPIYPSMFGVVTQRFADRAAFAVSAVSAIGCGGAMLLPWVMGLTLPLAGGRVLAAIPLALALGMWAAYRLSLPTRGDARRLPPDGAAVRIAGSCDGDCPGPIWPGRDWPGPPGRWFCPGCGVCAPNTRGVMSSIDTSHWSYCVRPFHTRSELSLLVLTTPRIAPVGVRWRADAARLRVGAHAGPAGPRRDSARPLPPDGPGPEICLGRADVAGPRRVMPGNGVVMPGDTWPTRRIAKSLPVIGSLYFLRRKRSLTRSSRLAGAAPGQAPLIQHQRMRVLLQAEQQFLFPLPLLLLAPDRHRHRHEREHDRHRDQQDGHRVASRVRVESGWVRVPHAFAILGCHASTATSRVVCSSGRSPSGRPWAR